MSVLESLAYARPVIATRIGGLPELVRHDVDGLLVPPFDAAQLEGALRWMADHRDRAVEMGREGRNSVEREFDGATHYERVRAVYEQVLRR